jgi:hypothetical protein
VPVHELTQQLLVNVALHRTAGSPAEMSADQPPPKASTPRLRK